MNDNGRPNKRLGVLVVILLLLSVLFSILVIMPFRLTSEFQTNELCEAPESNSLKQSQQEKILDQLECSSDSNKQLINLFLLGIINIDDLTMWVLGVDRRVVVLKMMHEKRMIQASDIAESTDRSLQNISYAMRELEKKGLIKCLTPEKHTWKKYIPTEKGTEVFEKLKENDLLGK